MSVTTSMGALDSLLFLRDRSVVDRRAFQCAAAMTTTAASLHPVSVCSFESAEYQQSPQVVGRLAKLSRHRSLTLDSVETVRSPTGDHGTVPGVLDHPEDSSRPPPVLPSLITTKPSIGGSQLLSTDTQPSSGSAGLRSSHYLPLHRSEQPLARQTLASPAVMMMTMGETALERHVGTTGPSAHQPAAPAQTGLRRKALSFYRAERRSTVSRPASPERRQESPSAVRIRPRLVHHSPPPWSTMGELDEPWADRTGDSPLKSQGQTPSIEPTSCISPNHHQYVRHHQAKPSPKRSGPGLGKLFKSVKASLKTGSTLDLSGSMNTAAHGPDNQGSQQGWLSLNKAKSSSLKSVEVDSRTALAQEEEEEQQQQHHHHHPLDITMALDQEESNSLSSGSYSTMHSSATSTLHSSSTHDLNGYGKERVSPLINSLDPHRSPNMSSTRTACNQSPSSASCFENAYGSSNHHHHNIHGRHDHHPKLKLKASFSFLNNLKRAVGGGVDHSLSFSFHNTNSISLPFGTVLRNNGLDPLPHSHPLPLKGSQSSPLSFNYPSSLPPRLEKPSYFVPPTQPTALSSSSPDLFDVNPHQRNASSSLSHLHVHQRRREEDSSLHPPQGQRNTYAEQDPSESDPPASKVPEEAPTLNLRPVSVPFAAGFSEQFLLSNLHSDPPAESLLGDQPKKERQPTGHQDHCSCCSSLVPENAALKNRVKELELRIYRSQSSKPS